MTRKREAFTPTSQQKEMSKICMLTLSNTLEACMEDIDNGSIGRVEFMSVATRDIIILLYEYNCRLVEEHTGMEQGDPDRFMEILKNQLEHHLNRKTEKFPNGF